jgi:hypothetical protein
MARAIESTGEIEIFAHPSSASTRGSVPFFDQFTVGDRVSLVFSPNDGGAPPYTLKIFSPAGANIMDTLVRELPTGGPQSPPAIEFVVSSAGTYRIEIRELRGRQRGEARLRVG